MKKSIILIPVLLFFSQCHGQLARLVAKNEAAVLEILTFDEYGNSRSIGTGFFITPEGTGLTNVHVLENAKFAFARDVAGRVFPIEKITRTCRECDIAEFTVKTNGQKCRFLPLTNKIPAKGSDIFVIGNPRGFEFSATEGIISSIRLDENSRIQISAPTSPGNSGSPVMNMKGEVFAIVTSQMWLAQNCNFASWLGCMDKMTQNSDIFLSHERSGDFILLNQVCPTEPSLVVNSIEFLSNKTVVNYTYINTSLLNGDQTPLFVKIGNAREEFYIEDAVTGQKYHAIESTVGLSQDAPTYLKFGEIKQLKVIFPPVTPDHPIHIIETMKGPEWSVYSINVRDEIKLDYNDRDFVYKTFCGKCLYALLNKNFEDALTYATDFLDENEDDAFANHLFGIASHKAGNEYSAREYIKYSLELDPTNIDYYINSYLVQKWKKDNDTALKHISSAIQLNNGLIPLYLLRADLYSSQKLWQEALDDLNHFIEKSPGINGSAYYNRGIAKISLGDDTACEDFSIAAPWLTDPFDKLQCEWYMKDHCNGSTPDNKDITQQK